MFAGTSACKMAGGACNELQHADLQIIDKNVKKFEALNSIMQFILALAGGCDVHAEC